MENIKLFTFSFHGCALGGTVKVVAENEAQAKRRAVSWIKEDEFAREDAVETLKLVGFTDFSVGRPVVVHYDNGDY